MSAGDFNGDAITDLAIGVPGESFESVVGARGAGAVHIIRGAETTGLGPTGNRIYSQATAGITGAPESGDHFGYAIAAGDFNASGHTDLAIGSPGEDFSVKDGGYLNILLGTDTGIEAAGNQTWSQSDTGGGIIEERDLFGAALAAGKFDSISGRDLVIGAPGEDLNSTIDAGSVDALYGEQAGLKTKGDPAWTQASIGVTGTPESGDYFGAALAGGNFDGDAFTDVAIGTPAESVGTETGATVIDAGAVTILNGSNDGLHDDGFDQWTQETPGVTGTAESRDNFGWSLVSANFGSTSADAGLAPADLAIGAPLEDVGTTVFDAGFVHVLYGSGSGIAATGNQQLGQASQIVPGTQEPFDAFGSALAAGNWAGGSYHALAVGTPLEDIGSIRNAGNVTALYGSPSGIGGTGSTAPANFDQSHASITGEAENGDLFG